MVWVDGDCPLAGISAHVNLVPAWFTEWTSYNHPMHAPICAPYRASKPGSQSLQEEQTHSGDDLAVCLFYHHQSGLRIIRQTYAGKLMTFAKVIGFSDTSVESWIRQENRPRLRAVLQVCFTFRITLSDLLLHDPETLNVAPVKYIDRPFAQRGRRYSESTKTNLRQALRYAAVSGDSPPVSLKETGGD